MLEVAPVVRHMLLCDDVRQRPNNPGKLDILGLTSALRATEVVRGLHRVILLGVFVQVTELYRDGRAKVVVADAETDEDVYAGPIHTVKGVADPLAGTPLFFRIGPVDFPRAGLYWVEFHYNDRRIAQEPLKVR
jgi:hypothetical protein